MNEMEKRFNRQIGFITEIDKIKDVFRQTYLLNGERKENDAEHSWHLAVMALVFSEYAPEGTDISRVIKMVLIHDLVEIDAGDTYLFDEAGNKDKAEREKKAAERIFGILPSREGGELKACWDEFEERQSKEARFALVLDRFQPFLHNWKTNGISWKEHGICRSQVLSRMEPVLKEFPDFYTFLKDKVAESVEKGWLLPD